MCITGLSPRSCGLNILSRVRRMTPLTVCGVIAPRVRHKANCGWYRGGSPSSRFRDEGLFFYHFPDMEGENKK